MKSNLSRGKGKGIIYSAMRWFAIPKIAFLKPKTMYSPLRGEAISGAALCFPPPWPQPSQFVVFRSLRRLLPHLPQARSWQQLAPQSKSLGRCPHGQPGCFVLCRPTSPALLLAARGKLCSCLFSECFCSLSKNPCVFPGWQGTPEAVFLGLFSSVPIFLLRAVAWATLQHFWLPQACKKSSRLWNVLRFVSWLFR